MIVKFTPRGTGRGSGPVEYLLGRDRNRDGAMLLSGDADQTRQLIDSSRYAKKYTSGVLSFQEPDISDAAKRQIMDSFEKALLPGLDGDQYDCLWVEHRDKGRLELNFVVANIELTTGHRLQPYYAPADRPRIDAWKVVTNAEYGLHDPDDPANQRAMTYPADLPRDRLKAQQQITGGLLALAQQGEIRSRRDVIETLESAGFTVTRETKSSISIADPENGRPLRLQGKLYERHFTHGSGLRGEIEAASREYRAGREARLREARERLAVGIERKRAENQRRHCRPAPEIAPDRTQELDGHRYTGIPDVSSGRERHRDHGLVHRPPGERNPQQPNHAGDVAREGWQRGSEPLRRGPAPVREDRRERRTVSGRLSGHGGVLSDESGARAAERLRATTARLRAAAEDMAKRLRQFADHVRDHQTRQRGVEQAGRALEQSGQRLEREGGALDARRQEALKQHHRGHDRGMSL